MNTFNIITSKLVIVCFLCFGDMVSIYAKSPLNNDIIRRVENLNTIIDVRVTEEVTEQVINLVEKRRNEAQTILGRTSLYFPMIENAKKKKNLPDELKYITVVETGLLPNTESHQGAAGIWQFMEGTAELYGLKVERYIDERRDLVKSTDKALDYLKLLYESYGNWTLAIAAYNCGTGTLNKAIKKAGGVADYWQIYEYLPKETRKYIPRFIAVSYLMNYYYLHDLTPSEPSEDLKYIITVKVFEKTEFKKLSKELEIDLDLIRFLNPMYLKDVIPENEDGEYHLVLPDMKMFTFIEKYSSLEHITTSPYSFVRVPSNESDPIENLPMGQKIEQVAIIQRRYNLTRDHFKESAKLKALAKVLIPESEKPILYKMKRKESLIDIAKANDIPLNDLLAFNNIDPDKGLPPGSIIRISK